MSVDVLGVGTELNPHPASTGVLASHVEVPPAKYDFFGNVIINQPKQQDYEISDRSSN